MPLSEIKLNKAWFSYKEDGEEAESEGGDEGEGEPDSQIKVRWPNFTYFIYI